MQEQWRMQISSIPLNEHGPPGGCQALSKLGPLVTSRQTRWWHLADSCWHIMPTSSVGTTLLWRRCYCESFWGYNSFAPNYRKNLNSQRSFRPDASGGWRRQGGFNKRVRGANTPALFHPILLTMVSSISLKYPTEHLASMNVLSKFT